MALCSFPNIIRDPNFEVTGHEKMIVPCGKCFNCLKNRRRSWTFRLKYEALNSVVSYFATISERDECLHPLCKRDLQLLFKKLRKRGMVFTYYAIGEYGSKTGRPHYHIMFFFKEFVSLFDLETALINCIDFGFITLSSCCAERIGYITHYHVRPKEPKNAMFDVPTFQLVSNGIGLQFIDSKLLQYLHTSENNLVRTFDGNVLSLPRYYRKKYSIPAKEIDPTHGFYFVRDIARKKGYSEFEYLRDMKELDEFYRTKYNLQEKF